MERTPGVFELVINSLIYATAATIISQAMGVLVMWRLGLPPKKLAHEIEDVQNSAVGASFFIISLVTAIVIGVLAADPAPADTWLENLAWIVGGIVLATIYTGISFMLTHRIMGRIEGENVYTYIRREIVLEQNAALAFFLGGLLVSSYISVIAQVI
jgi:hypothetical protein